MQRRRGPGGACVAVTLLLSATSVHADTTRRSSVGVTFRAGPGRTVSAGDSGGLTFTGQATVHIPASASGYAAGALIYANVDTQSLVAAGSALPTRNDVRLFNGPSEIDRVFIDTSTIAFRLQSALGAGVSADYTLRYGSVGATAPPENRANVYSSYADGYSLGSFTTTGTVTAASQYLPEFWRVTNEPRIRRTPGTYDLMSLRDPSGLIYENGTWRTWYSTTDNGAFSGYVPASIATATSSDLLTWTKGAIQLTQGPLGAGGGANGGITSNPAVIKYGSTYYMYYVGTASSVGGVGVAPFELYSASAASSAGPWGSKQKLIPAGAAGSYDETMTGGGAVYTFDSGATYEPFYTAGSGSGATVSRGMAWGTMTTPTSTPVTKQALLIDGSTEQIENSYLYTDGLNYFMFADHVGIPGPNAATEYTTAQQLYWTSDRHNWSTAHQTTTLEPRYGEWDEATIGNPSVPVISGGVVTTMYDGSDWAAVNAAGSISGNLYRDLGVAVARIPFPQSSVIVGAVGSTATLSSVLTGDGAVVFRAKLGDTAATVGVKSGASTYVFGIGASDTLSFAGVATLFQRITNHVKTFRIERSGLTYRAFCSGQLVASGAIVGGVLDFVTGGNVRVERMDVEPLDISRAVIPTSPFYIDRFNRPNGAVGVNWVANFGLASLTISNGQLVTGLPALSFQGSHLLEDAFAQAQNQYAEATLVSIGANEADVCVNVSNHATYADFICANAQTPGNTIGLYMKSNNVQTVLQAPLAFTGNTVRVERNGTNVKVLTKAVTPASGSGGPWTTTINVTNAGLPTLGSPGIAHDSTSVLDNFYAGSL